ncbi:unnamed protein product [Plutella xylostella]|uniref:(diamondback moth) hypothetical protein n=1 Tax=Plutella xylostella TaxID=51655 RepID=A0A8S4D7Y9_PLUXY|nr:unnamed protein product [Plutella xylostella]
MEAVCGRGDAPCEVAALAAALHALHLYCAALAAALIICCAPKPPAWYGRVSWRGQNARGVASLALLAVWALGAAAAVLRASVRVSLAAALLAPAGGLAAAALHVALWSRRAAAPLLYLALYHLLAAAAAAARIYQHLHAGLDVQAIDLHIQALSFIFASIVAIVDCICFYDEVTKSFYKNCKPSAAPTQSVHNVAYEHCDAHFYSKITFFWLNPLLYRGYETPLESEDLGELPEKERSYKHYHKFNKIYKDQVLSKDELKEKQSLFRCYIRMVWPNFYLAGILKLFSDVMGLVPPLGLAVIIDYIAAPPAPPPAEPVTVSEFLNNGYVMLLILTLALIAQALLSQNSTHLVTVEGTRLKTALQGMIYDKCMRLAPWAASMNDVDEESPLLSATQSAQAQLGLLTNLVSQDTYNIMSCVWICHYTWAIPLKVSAILYLLYTKLGVSAIIGTVASIVLITPLQFYIGKKISDNSKEIAKCSDHRISKMTEILQGINVIKLYVWEDLFNEKILNLRELELKHLNKDTIHWNLLTFTTQASTILVTFITFTAYVFMHTAEGLTAVNVFAGLALFNQLTVPLLILPVTVLMIIQAMVSSKRIKEFLDLPESNNVQEDEDSDDAGNQKQKTNVFNEAFIDHKPEDEDSFTETDKIDNQAVNNLDNDNDSDDEIPSPTIDDTQPLVKFQNALFSWGIRNDNSQIEVDDLDIPPGKLIMVVGATGSGKSSLLSAILGEMYLERGSVTWNGARSTWYAGQPPWLLEGSVRHNIVLGGSWCRRRYARVLRAAGLRPDLQLLPGMYLLQGRATGLRPDLQLLPGMYGQVQRNLTLLS